MALFSEALSRLAGLAVSGVANNYDVGHVPEELSRAQLPALLVLPVDTVMSGEARLFAERGEGFTAVAFSEGPRTVRYTTTHLLLAVPVGAGSGLRTALPVLVDLVDAYVAALADDVTLGDALLRPAQVGVEPGVFQYGSGEFYGCAFRHTWLMTAG